MSTFRRKRWWFYARRAFWIMIAWMMISNVLFFYDFFTLSGRNALGDQYDFTQAFTANLIVGLSAGLIGGLLTVNLMEFWLRKYAFWRALMLIVFTYVLAALAISSLGAIYLKSVEYNLPFLDMRVVKDSGFIFSSWIFIKNFIIWLFIVLLTLIVLMINDKYGPGVFPDYLKGRYFHPKREERIFMFADIKNATGIAEILGEAEYFNFLKAFFKDITPAIIETSGEIYQYVGDEIVVSWKMKKGLKNANAIRCFYRMKALIDRKKDRYMSKFGLYPEFKVGFHFGKVMVGEIGQIKRDIAFSGDVLNTTSRIQAKCNELGVDILASEVFGNLITQLPEGVTTEVVGKQSLKGKISEVSLITFRYEN